MKRIIASILCGILIVLQTFTAFAATAGDNTKTKQAGKTSSEDAEILRAISYGFVPDKIQGDWNKAITFSQYCTMLENMLSRYNKKLIPKWEKTAAKALASNESMHRDHGMLAAYYAACLMGIGKTTNGDWNYFDQVLGVEVAHGFDNNFDKWFPDCGKPSPFYDIDYRKHVSGWNYITGATFWCMGQFSPVSGKQVFEADFTHKTLRPMDNLTRKEAVWAVLRLYESTFSYTEQTTGKDKKSVKILSLADQRRNSILESDTDITRSDSFVQGKTYTGTAYYVSNSGNDNNDGTSPDTPWATISRVNSAELKYGDAVFFKRGDIWYNEQIWGQQGITYSAYSTGPKPTFSGSLPENAADPNQWKLYYTDKSGMKIWIFNKELRDCAGIFFNGGTGWANKVATYWDGKHYVTNTGKSFDAKSGLNKDLDFFSCIDLTRIDPYDRVSETGVTGPLYLRCDAGNPGDIYDNIEFSLDGTGFSPAGSDGRDVTVDNLRFIYFGMLGVSCAGDQGWTNTTVQNCEIGWCGGGATQYTYENGSSKLAYINNSGGAIHISGLRNAIINNYIHHCASKVFILALHYCNSASHIYSDTCMKGNLLEYNASALHLVDYMETENPSIPSGFKNISFDDNYVMYTGYGWVETQTLRTINLPQKVNLCAIEFGDRDRVNRNDGIYIRSNVFYLSKYALIHCYMSKDNQPVFSGNTYAQGQNGWLAMWRGRMLSITENGEDYIHKDLLDKTGTVLLIQ